MALQEITYSDALPVDGYGPGFFRVGGLVLEGNLLLIGADTPRVWTWETLPEVAAELAGRIDLLIVGTGAAMTPPDPRVVAAFGRPALNLDPGLEPMATATACRTYNVLLAEGRRVAALLQALD